MIKRTSKQYIQSILAKHKEWSVLDIGCGYSANENANVICDIQDLSNFYKDKSFVKLENKKLPFKDNQFDFVIASHVLEHVEDIEYFIKELERISKRGYIEVPTTLEDNLVFENKKDHLWHMNFDDTDLKLLISKQINDEYKNSLDKIAKNQILKEIENFKIDEIPNNLVEEEVKILAQGMSEEDAKKSRKNFENVAKKRIKVGLILNEFGEQNKVKVTEQEIQSEVQKQLRMMPGQEKMVMEIYQKNPSALASLRGTVYEEKIIDLIKTKAKPNKKEISKEEAEKILKEHQKQEHDHNHQTEKKADTKKAPAKPKSIKSNKTQVKKVSKK